MKKHEVYKQYDDLFNNKKIKHIQREFGKINNGIEKLEKTHEERLNKFSLYCGAFIEGNDCVLDNKLRIKKDKGIQTFSSWGNCWCSIKGDYNIDYTIKKCVPFLSDEGKEVWKQIESINPTIDIERKMFNVGKVNKYHRQYFYLPSYVKKRIDYPINLIIKKSYGQVALSIPAFHRYPIISKWNFQADAQSLKRQMLLIEFYDDIKKEIIPILKKHKKKLNWIEENNDKVIENLAKYEILTNI